MSVAVSVSVPVKVSVPVSLSESVSVSVSVSVAVSGVEDKVGELRVGVRSRAWVGIGARAARVILG